MLKKVIAATKDDCIIAKDFTFSGAITLGASFMEQSNMLNAEISGDCCHTVPALRTAGLKSAS